MYDPIVAEVRKNREELFAECNYDVATLHKRIGAKRAAREAAGFRYETKEEREVRIERNKQQREAEGRRISVV